MENEEAQKMAAAFLASKAKNAKRQQVYRAKKAEKGLVSKTIFCKPETDAQNIIKYIENLNVDAAVQQEVSIALMNFIDDSSFKVCESLERKHPDKTLDHRRQVLALMSSLTSFLGIIDRKKIE